MSTLQHDSAGFLVGELIESNKDALATQQATLAQVRRIRSDVSAIASAMGISKRSGRVSPGPSPSTRSTGSTGATPTGTTSTGTTRGRVVVEPVGRSSRAVSATRAGGAQAVTVVARGRDASGRFVASGKTKDASGTVNSGSPDSRDGLGRFTGGGRSGSGGGVGEGGGMLGARLDNLGNALKGITDVVGGTDPAIAAAGEIKSVLEPLGRGAFALFGRTGQQKKERWYSRILKALTNRKADGGTGSTGGDSDGGIGVGFPMKLIAGIGAAIVSVLGVLGAGGIGVFVGAKIYEWLDNSGIATKVFDVFDSVGNWFKEKISGATKTVTEIKNNYVAGKSEALGAGGSNNAHRMMEDGNSGTPGPITSVAQLAGRVVGNVQRGAEYMAGAGSRNVAENRALQTGANYRAGNIGGLNDAQTRALVASTALTESGGGKLGVVNSAGYMGRYQAGAGWLADAGLINGGSGAVKAAMAKDGFKSEYKWGESGGMTKFLKDDSNWTGGMNYKSYMASSDAQDKAFKTNSDSAYTSLMARGIINADTPPEQIAGLLKARHLSGLGGAAAVAANKTGPADANGTTARKYYDDVALDKNGFLGTYSGKTSTTGLQAISPSMVPMSVPSKFPATPEINIPAPSAPEKDRPTVVIQKDVVGQNLSDRSIAHIASGGIGSNYG